MKGETVRALVGHKGVDVRRRTCVCRYRFSRTLCSPSVTMKTKALFVVTKDMQRRFLSFVPEDFDAEEWMADYADPLNHSGILALDLNDIGD